MRCPDCEKMVSYDTEAEVEVTNEPEVSEDGVVTLTVRRVLPCGECGTELKEAELEMEAEAEILLRECHCEEDAEAARLAGEEPEAYEWEAEVLSAEPTTDTVTKDRHGRPIKSSRYMKTLYGADVEVEVKCSRCGASETLEMSDSLQASAFEELV